MKKYVAFLRAINVGGTKVIKMEDLKRMFESFGLANVQTYIQSGNVIFESNDSDSAFLETKIESQLEKRLGYKVEIFLRTMRELSSIAKQTHFKVQEDETLHIVFLREKPDKKAEQTLMTFKSDADDFAVIGREVYNLRRNRERSVFSNNFIEKIFKIPGTTRNITTIHKILEKFK